MLFKLDEDDTGVLGARISDCVRPRQAVYFSHGTIDQAAGSSGVFGEHHSSSLTNQDLVV